MRFSPGSASDSPRLEIVAIGARSGPKPGIPWQPPEISLESARPGPVRRLAAPARSARRGFLPCPRPSRDHRHPSSRRPVESSPLLLSLAILPAPARAREGDDWVAKRVLIKPGCCLRVGNQLVDDEKREVKVRRNYPGNLLVYRVTEVRGPWLGLSGEKEALRGWIPIGEVIPYDRAIDYFSDEIRARPSSASAYVGRGKVWNDRKETDKALADYTEAIRLDPGNAAIRVFRGVVWCDKERWDEAIADFDRAIAIDPKDATVHAYRGGCLGRKKEYDRALVDLTEAIRLDPKLEVGYGNRACVRAMKAEYDKALADLDEAIRLDPEDAAAHTTRGTAWLHKREYGKAIADYDAAFQADPTNVHALFSRSIAQLVLRRDVASTGFEKVLELEGWRGVHSLQAAILGHFAARREGNGPLATRFLDEALFKCDESWPYPVVRYLRGELDEKALLAASDGADKMTDTRCVLGFEDVLRGRKDEAIAHFRWVKENGVARDDTIIISSFHVSCGELDRLEKPAANRP